MKVGTLIKQRRLELGLSQKELAERCGYADRSAISRIESGDRDIPVKQLKKIAAALGMEPEDLVVEATADKIEDLYKYKQKHSGDIGKIVEILEKDPDISRALLQYAQYLHKVFPSSEKKKK